jgi:hypothetical protein
MCMTPEKTEETVRPGGTGIWAPVVPEPGPPQDWMSQDPDDVNPLIVRSVD